MNREEILEFAKPSGFCRMFLGMDLYPKQKEIVDSCIPRGARVAAKTCNESGKTSRLVTGLILWHLFVYDKGDVVSTAGVWRQVRDQLIPNLKRYSHRFPEWRFLDSEIVTPKGKYVGFSTNDAGKFEGFHERGPTEPLLIIVDEAKTVKDDVFQAIARCRPTRLFICSSPGFAEGEFYRAFTSKSEFYKTFTVKAEDCPHLAPERIAQDREMWKGNPALVASMLDAEFMEMAEDAILSVADFENCVNNPPDFNPLAGERKAFCDFAAGGDENVLAVRDGNRVKVVDAWTQADTMSAVGRFIIQFKKQGLKPSEIYGDSGGVGHVMMDCLAEAGWPINWVNFGGTANRPDLYVSLGAEMWLTGAEQIKQAKVILPDDDKLRGQLVSRKKIVGSRGRMALEKKDVMKRRGLPSPDRADAVLGAICDTRMASVNLLGLGDEDREQEVGYLEAHRQEPAMAGFNAGW
jgi:hypothetical protein